MINITFKINGETIEVNLTADKLMVSFLKQLVCIPRVIKMIFKSYEKE